ncbi:ankyrin repeat domain-containing protein [Thalassomonas sp. RHCl1]|uniref:ankyrin repeat domain-containing protein n=1 Tax=Thalassomonas sp. RHCl1 TaxID=2995320 RepID=UPI00248B6DAC|nr:ankyrin repeat domain-containing protein [Thalassomonas sp. RHCl1]
MKILLPATVFTLSLALVATTSFSHDKPTHSISGQSPVRSSDSVADGLITAISNNDQQALTTLLNSTLDVNQLIPGDGTALIIAARQGKLEMLNTLLRQGADVNQITKSDGTALTPAAMENQVAAAALLYNRGADINAVAPDDETALITASRNGHLAMVKFLVENGADVNLAVRARTLNGTTLRSPLSAAKDPAIREYLLGMGAKS